MSGLYAAPSYNLATTTKWLLIVPFKQIDNEAQDEFISMNLTNFEMPEIGMARADFNIGGTPIPISLNISNDMDKRLTFNYLLSSDWHQYKVIYRWYKMMNNDWAGGTDLTKKDFSMDLSVVMLSEYKKTMFQVDYKNCMIENIAGISMNLQDDESIINHSFTVNYSHYEIKGLLDDNC